MKNSIIYVAVVLSLLASKLNAQETLQDTQIDAVMASLLGAVEKKCAARLR